MENKEQQILSEIKAMMATIRQQMEMLDAKMAELQQMSRFEGEDVAPIVLDIDTFDLPVEEVPEEMPAPAEPSDDLPFDLPVEETPVEEPVQEAPVAAEPEIETVVEAASEPMTEDLPEEILLEDHAAEETAPIIVAEPEPEVVVKPLVKEAIIDAMTEKQAWRTDMPGTQVKDVRLAISLHERVLFINHLFSEDPMAFQTTVNKVNASASLDEVVEYVKETFPQWDLDSDLVYRFMMAVRRKIR
jgi:hypothetical protein